ncbi:MULTISPECIES: chorismate mutase [unclassified Geodermatophilus]|uniref:chorismate mutase n=1 Tax=unclassified Geodermatophilus TaxID=2637632 RepID=UPI003EF04877
MRLSPLAGDGSAGPVSGQELAPLRIRLDSIDEALLDRLRERLECCRAIAAVKERHGLPMMQPDRIEFVRRRASRYATDHGLDAGFVERLYALILAEACRLESALMGEDRQPGCEPMGSCTIPAELT